MHIDSHKRKEIVIGLCLIVFSLIVLFFLSPLFIDAEDTEILALSPRLFPELAAWLILALSTLFLIVTLVEKSDRISEASEEESFSSKEQELKVILAALISIAYLFVLIYLGFIPATIISIFCLFLTQKKMPIFKIIILSFGTAIIVYLFFHNVMDVHFPVGTLFN